MFLMTNAQRCAMQKVSRRTRRPTDRKYTVNGWIIVFVSGTVVLASFVHTTSGFAFALITMALWPMLLPIADATHLLMFSSFLVISIVTFQFRRHIDLRLVVVPSVVAVVGNAVGVFLVGNVPEALLIRVLGALLIVLAMTLFLTGDRFRVEPTAASASVAGGISGIMNGMFNIPGPPIVLYYSAATRTKEEYIATTQFFFWIALVQRMVLVLISTPISREVFILAPFTIAGSILGMVLGFRVFRGLSGTRVRQTVFALMMVSGLLYLVR